ncbi:CAP domain-containing protein [Lactarius psammicola]|nr:CAP domain-containing protein [Lactarius psammicola]
MTRFFPLLFVALSLVSSQVAFGAPSCSHGMKDVDACVSKCKTKFGWPGFAMGHDRWGSVANPSDEDTSDRVVKACGGPKNHTSSEPAVGAGSPPPVATSTPPSYVSPTPIVGAGPSKLPSSSSTTVTSSTHYTSKSSPVPHPSSSLHSSGDVDKSTKKSSTSLTPVANTYANYYTTAATFLSSSTTSSTPKPSLPTTLVSGTVSSGDISAYLSAHNNVRAQHGADPLTWSDELSAKAQQWADGCQFKHSGGSLGPFGENLAAGTGDGYTIATAVKDWTDEVSEYDPNNPVPSHFTQVVWKGTTQVGCAVKDCSGIFDAKFGLAHYYVCEYSPAGNVIGEFPQNVQK